MKEDITLVNRRANGATMARREPVFSLGLLATDRNVLNSLGLNTSLLSQATVPLQQLWAAATASNNQQTILSKRHQQIQQVGQQQQTPQQTPPPNDDKTNKVGRLFVCRVCNHSFGYKHVLQNHERTHTGEKPFECHQCHKRSVKHSRAATLNIFLRHNSMDIFVLTKYLKNA